MRAVYSRPRPSLAIGRCRTFTFAFALAFAFAFALGVAFASPGEQGSPQGSWGFCLLVELWQWRHAFPSKFSGCYIVHAPFYRVLDWGSSIVPRQERKTPALAEDFACQPSASMGTTIFIAMFRCFSRRLSYSFNNHGYMNRTAGVCVNNQSYSMIWCIYNIQCIGTNDVAIYHWIANTQGIFTKLSQAVRQHHYTILTIQKTYHLFSWIHSVCKHVWCFSQKIGCLNNWKQQSVSLPCSQPCACWITSCIRIPITSSSMVQQIFTNGYKLALKRWSGQNIKWAEWSKDLQSNDDLDCIYAFGDRPRPFQKGFNQTCCQLLVVNGGEGINGPTPETCHIYYICWNRTTIMNIFTHKYIYIHTNSIFLPSDGFHVANRSCRTRHGCLFCFFFFYTCYVSVVHAGLPTMKLKWRSSYIFLHTACT